MKMSHFSENGHFESTSVSQTHLVFFFVFFRSLKKELDFAQPLASKSRELDENVRNPSDPGEERVIDEDKGQEQEQEVTGNVDVEDLHVPVERSDKTFCLSAGYPFVFMGYGLQVSKVLC